MSPVPRPEESKRVVSFGFWFAGLRLGWLVHFGLVSFRWAWFALMDQQLLLVIFDSSIEDGRNLIFWEPSREQCLLRQGFTTYSLGSVTSVGRNETLRSICTSK